jgi:chromosome partitioning protein
MYDSRTRLSAQVAEEVRTHFGDLVCDTVIPRSVRLSEAPSFGQPVVTLDPTSKGATAYRVLATEVENRYGLEVHVPPPPKPKTDRPPDGRPAVTKGEPGPRGRGFGTSAPEPDGLDEAWPRPEFWSVYQ